MCIDSVGLLLSSVCRKGAESTDLLSQNLLIVKKTELIGTADTGGEF
jgi:hypothetical protein